MHTKPGLLEASNSVTTVVPTRWRSVLMVLAILLVFLGLATALQRLGGAGSVELSGYPDEPAHFVTGILFKDYLQTFPRPPMIPFAKDFYIHRPKVAIGHWPPVLYIIEGVWFTLFRATRVSVLALMALICSGVAATIYEIVRRTHGIVLGIAAGVFFICMGFVQEQTSQVMADMLVALFGLRATLAFADFLGREKAAGMVRFAAWSLLAIFTKNNGLYLAFLPIIAISLTRRFSLLKGPILWIGAAIVGLPSAVWIFWSRKYVETSWMEKPGLDFFWRASWQDLRFLYLIFGAGFLAFAVTGAIRAFNAARSSPDLRPVTLVAAALSVLLMQSLAPAGIEWRFLIPAVACMIPLLVSGNLWIAESFRLRSVPRLLPVAVLAAIAVLIAPARSFAIPHKPYRGFAEIADLVQASPELRGGEILVSSFHDGEGLLISELAMRYPCSEGFVLRASKVLAESDWLGRSYRSRFATAQDVAKYLDDLGVDLLVVDDRAGAAAPLHQEQILEVVRQHPEVWLEPSVFPARKHSDLTGARILVFRRAGGAPHAGDRVRRDLEEILRRKLGD